MKFIKEEYHDYKLLPLLQEWNNTNRHYLTKIQQYRDRSWFIRFEDIETYENKGAILLKMAEHFKIPNVVKSWRDPGARRLEPRAWNIDTNTFRYLKDEKYKGSPEHHYNKDRTEFQMKFIRDHIDKELCRILGYEVL